MAITVDWNTKIVTVPQSFLTFLGGSVYQLDTEAFKVAINEIESSEDGIVQDQIINHSTAVSLGGIQYARVIEIINGYTITFEDGSYVVNLIGSNNNILDVTNLNSVQVRSNNSAGLINLLELQFGIYQGAVWVDQAGGAAGTAYPKGTPLDPVNNVPDAVTIAQGRGFSVIRVLGDLTLDTGDNVEGYIMIGENASQTMITVNPGSDTLGCEIREAYVQGTLDGGTILRNCVIDNLNYINGFVFQCMINPGTITLGGVSTAHFLNCYSGIPGTGTPIIDMNGVSDLEDTPLAMRNYNGGIELRNKTGPGAVSLDINSGQVKIHPTCVAGQVVVRGTAHVTDSITGEDLHSSTINGGLQLVNQAVDGEHIHDMWMNQGLDPNNPVTISDDGTTTTKSAGSVTILITDTSITRP